jgi:hypothetical protein
VSDLRAAVFVETRATVNMDNWSMNFLIPETIQQRALEAACALAGFVALQRRCSSVRFLFPTACHVEASAKMEASRLDENP